MSGEPQMANLKNNLRKPHLPTLEEVKKIIHVLPKDSDIIPDFTISRTNDLTFIEIAEIAMGAILVEYWWLTDEFKDRNVIPKQITISDQIKVYDFTREIDHIKVKTINQISNFFVPLINKFGSNKPKHLVFDNIQQDNFNSGFPMNGQVKERQTLDMIQFFPEAFSEGKYRKKEISKFPNNVDHFTSVLIHEFSHLIDNHFFVDWCSHFGWFELDKPVQLPGGRFKYFDCKNSDQCMGEYALVSPQEDFCESMVAFLLCPQIIKNISQKKYEFLKGITDQVNFEKTNNITKLVTTNQWPTLPKSMSVKVKKSEPFKFVMGKLI